MKRTLFIAFICIFLLVNSNAFGANINGSIEGAYGGTVTFDGSYTINSFDYWHEEIVLKYNNFSFIPGVIINGEIVYIYEEDEYEGYTKLRGNTTVKLDGTNYNVNMDVVIDDWWDATGSFCINEVYLDLDDDLLDIIELIYFDQMYLLVF